MKPTEQEKKNLDNCLEKIGTEELEQRVYGEEQADTEPFKPGEEPEPDQGASESPQGIKTDTQTRQIIAELASLSPVEYDRRRVQAAEDLGIRVATLDAEVQSSRPAQEGDGGQGSGVIFKEADPWPDFVTGAELLDDLVRTLKRFVVFSDEAAHTAALWILHSHSHDAATISPILAIESPEKRCGKTTLLSLLKALGRRSLFVSNVSAATLFRACEKWRPTFLIDEADSFLKDNEELRGILNSGHVRDSAAVLRSVGEDFEPRLFSTWAPKAIALIGNLPPTLTDRSISIHMRRRRQDEKVDRLRLDRLTEFDNLERRCTRWATDHLAALKSADPDVPRDLHDRAADNWRCLLAIADLVGKTWPERARAAAVNLSVGDLGDESAAIMLLADIHDFFDERGVDHIPSVNLCEALHGKEDRPWPEWRHGKAITTRQVARLLRPFGVRPKGIRDGEKTPKGYDRKDFSDAWTRYLGNRSATPQQDNIIKDLDDKRSATQRNHVADENACNQLKNKGCCGVADEKGGNGNAGEDSLVVEEVVDDEMSSSGNIEGEDKRRHPGSSARADNRPLF